MKNLIYTTVVDKKDRDINDSEILNITQQSWKHYCQKYDIDFFIIDKTQLEDTYPHWFRYFIFDLKPGYDRYLYIDADLMVKWDAPNIFDIYEDPYKLYAVRDNAGLSWVWEGIKIYQKMFPDTKLDWEEYFNSGMLLFSKEHELLITEFKKFYVNNKEIVDSFRKTYRKGFDQNVFNYFCRYNEIDIELISEKWNLFHMVRKEVFFNLYFTEMAYFWHFNGLDRSKQVSLIESVWNNIKDNYK